MLDIRFVALPSGGLPSLFESRSESSNGLTPGAFGFEA